MKCLSKEDRELIRRARRYGREARGNEERLAHHSCVIPFTKITMFPYSEQVQDIEHYGASVGDDLDAK